MFFECKAGHCEESLKKAIDKTSQVVQHIEVSLSGVLKMSEKEKSQRRRELLEAFEVGLLSLAEVQRALLKLKRS